MKRREIEFDKRMLIIRIEDTQNKINGLVNEFRQILRYLDNLKKEIYELKKPKK